MSDNSSLSSQQCLVRGLHSFLESPTGEWMATLGSHCYSVSNAWLVVQLPVNQHLTSGLCLVWCIQGNSPHPSLFRLPPLSLLFLSLRIHPQEITAYEQFAETQHEDTMMMTANIHWAFTLPDPISRTLMIKQRDTFIFLLKKMFCLQPFQKSDLAFTQCQLTRDKSRKTWHPMVSFF